MKMEDDSNLRAKTMLGGIRGAAAWAIIVALAVLPVWIVLSTLHWVLLVATLGLSFWLNQVLESGATTYFNKCQAMRSVNLDKMLDAMRQMAEDAKADDDGTNES